MQVAGRLRELRSHSRVRTVLRVLFMLATALAPLTGVTALGYIISAAFFLYTGIPPLGTPGVTFLAIFVPYYTLKWGLNFLGNYLVRDPQDAWRSYQTWFSYAVVNCYSVFQAVKVCCMAGAAASLCSALMLAVCACGALAQSRVTGEPLMLRLSEPRDGVRRISRLEVPNILLFVLLIIGFVVAFSRFFHYGDIAAPWDSWACTCMLCSALHCTASRVGALFSPLADGFARQFLVRFCAFLPLCAPARSDVSFARVLCVLMQRWGLAGWW